MDLILHPIGTQLMIKTFYMFLKQLAVKKQWFDEFTGFHICV